MDRFLTNYPNLKDVYENTTIQNVARFLILLIVIVGIYALCNGTIGEDYLEGRGFYNSQNITAMDHYFCPNCNTIVPCPYNHNGVGILCPSCGYKTEVMRRGGRAQNRGGVYGSYYYGAGGFGRNGGLGLGPGGNLVCPDCGYIMPHQIGVPCYTVQCPKCGTTMARQIAANSSYYGVGGFGRNGGLGLGPGGNLICPDCGYLMPHQTGVPSYTVQCPQCGTTMARQIAANSSPAYYNINSNNPGFQNQSGVASAATTPPITSDAVMTHVYRGVCSKCHQIIDNPR